MAAHQVYHNNILVEAIMAKSRRQASGAAASLKTPPPMLANQVGGVAEDTAGANKKRLQERELNGSHTACLVTFVAPL